MNIEIFIGLIGIFVTSIFNLIISIKTLKSSKKLEIQKSLISFTIDKINILRETRSKLKSLVDISDLFHYQITKEKFPSLMINYKKNKKTFYDNIEKYKEIKFCIPKNKRIKLEKKERKISNLDSQLYEELINNVKEDDNPNNFSSDYYSKVVKTGRNMLEYSILLKEIIENTLIELSDIVSSDKLLIKWKGTAYN